MLNDVLEGFKQRIALDRCPMYNTGTQQKLERPQQPSPGMWVNARCTNSTTATSSKEMLLQWHRYPPFKRKMVLSIIVSTPVCLSAPEEVCSTTQVRKQSTEASKMRWHAEVRERTAEDHGQLGSVMLPHPYHESVKLSKVLSRKTCNLSLIEAYNSYVWGFAMACKTKTWVQLWLLFLSVRNKTNIFPPVVFLSQDFGWSVSTK